MAARKLVIATMPILPTFILPKNILTALRSGSNHVQSSALLAEMARSEPKQVFEKMDTSLNGLSRAEAASRATYYGPNVVTKELKHRRLRILGRACVNPLVILLLLLAIVSLITGDVRAATVMLSMVVLGVALRFIQESRADDAAAKLKAMISVTATVVRDGQPQELPLGQLVPGDVVQLSAGDMIPADLRIISSKDMFVIQSSLTGESLPVEKFDTKEDAAAKSVLELKNTCFLGTSVESGSATGVIVETGFKTYLGGMAQAIVGQNVQTSFDQGVAQVHVANDPLHAGHGSDGVLHQRFDQARLGGGVFLRPGGGRRPYAGNAAHDRLGVPLPRRHRHVAAQGDRQTPELDPEPRRDGRALHRQDGNAHARPRDPRTPLRRRPQRG